MTSFTADDHRHMTRALRLAEGGLYTTDPNPRVGCVIVRNGAVVGEGAHLRTGEPHAEIHALRQAATRARGATVYITLEPCNHHGRTPPCVDALLEAGVARVIAAAEDPNPRVAGNGLARLRDQGVETAHGLLAEQSEALNPGFMRRMRLGRPYVRCKLAMSLDGRTAMASGESRWITGDAARRDVHHWRARSGAIVTGIGTILADDPALTVRDVPEPAGGHRQPMRVILDSFLRTPPKARVFEQPGQTAILFAHPDTPRQMALEEAGAYLWLASERSEHRVSPWLSLALLAENGINEVLIEAGPTVSGAYLRAGLVDELIVYMAPHLMGHEGGALLELPGITRMAQRIGVERRDVRTIGEDLRIIVHPANAELS